MANPESDLSPECERFIEVVLGKPRRARVAAFVAVLRGERSVDTDPTVIAEILGEANFNPSEPRDELGRWTAGGYDDRSTSATDPMGLDDDTALRNTGDEGGPTSATDRIGPWFPGQQRAKDSTAHGGDSEGEWSPSEFFGWWGFSSLQQQTSWGCGGLAAWRPASSSTRSVVSIPIRSCRCRGPKPMVNSKMRTTRLRHRLTTAKGVA